MGAEMSAEAIETRKAYQKEYRRKNREKINSQRKNWRAKNRNKVQQYNREYWERKAEKAKSIRASWEDYGIDKARYMKLQEIIRSGKHDDLVHSAACAADKGAAEHIILSVKENLSYKYIEYHCKLGRCSLGRTNFYGARRLFFHYLDVALKKEAM